MLLWLFFRIVFELHSFLTEAIPLGERLDEIRFSLWTALQNGSLHFEPTKEKKEFVR